MPNNFTSPSPVTNLPRIQALLRHTREVVGHRNELQKATGEHFNLFQILGVGHYEVSTHSALLCDLLSPKGSHGQGAVFLKCFIDILKLDGAFDAESAKVTPEVSIGPRTDTTGGRLDILIKDKHNRQIAIENKIHAKEQDNWVRRYRAGLPHEAPLIYLTLDGSSPTQIDPGQKDSVLCISYGHSILKWLEACRKEAATVPIIRESLTQYIHLIQHLTHQNSDSRMNTEIVNSVLNNEYDFDAYCALRDSDKSIKSEIVRQLGVRIGPRVPPTFAMTKAPESPEKHDGFEFCPHFLTQHNVKAVISFDSPNYCECYFGFELVDTSKPIVESSEVGQALTAIFRSKFGECSSSGRWPAWTPWLLHRNWNDDVLRSIKFGGCGFEDAILELINDLFEVAQTFERQMATAHPIFNNQ